MLNFIKRRLKSQKGAMDTILVTLLLVVVGIGAVVGLTSWVNKSKNSMMKDANITMSGIVSDANDSNTDN